MKVYPAPLTTLLVASARSIEHTAFPARYLAHASVPENYVWLVDRQGRWEVWLKQSDPTLPDAGLMASALARIHKLMPNATVSLVDRLVTEVAEASDRALARGEACPFCGETPHLSRCVVVFLRKQALV